MIKQAFIGVNDKNSDTIGGENFDGRKRLSGWLNKEMKIEMTDGRIIIGDFVCTDRSKVSKLNHIPYYTIHMRVYKNKKSDVAVSWR